MSVTSMVPLPNGWLGPRTASIANFIVAEIKQAVTSRSIPYILNGILPSAYTVGCQNVICIFIIICFVACYSKSEEIAAS